MNRRTFNKALLSLPFLSLPLFAGKEKTPQWIKFIDQIPKIGQKVLMIYNDFMESNYGWIKGGIVVKNHNSPKNTIKRDFVFLKETQPYSNGMVTMCYYYSEEGKYIAKTNRWTNRKKVMVNMEHVKMMFDTSCDPIYWIPITGDYPKILPPLPKYQDNKEQDYE